MLNKKFQSQSSAIASYNYSDLAANTGMTLFYGANVALLTQNQIYSSVIESVSALFNTSSYVKCLDVDFDLSAFNAPTTLRGTAIVNTCFALLDAASTGIHLFAYLVARIRKWDGTTETEIASATGSTFQEGGGGTLQHIECHLISIPITPFKKGEVLRLTIEGWGKQDAASNSGNIILGCDPMNRDGTYIKPSSDVPTSTTQLKIWVPFNLDL